MHDLLRTTGGADFFPPEEKIKLAEQLAQVKRPPQYSPARRKARPTTMSSRSQSQMSGRSVRLPTLSSHTVPRSLGAQTPQPHPSRDREEVPEHTRKFFQQSPQVNPKLVAKIHKNMQEKLYVRFASTRDAFRAFDSDHSGEVDLQEFKAALRRYQLIEARDIPQVEGMFHLCDEDGSGMINYREFAKWIKVPDKHENLMVSREDPYKGTKGGMSYIHRANWIRKFGVMCE